MILYVIYKDGFFVEDNLKTHLICRIISYGWLLNILRVIAIRRN